MLYVCLLLLLFTQDPPYDALVAKSQKGKEALEQGRFAEAVSIYQDLLQAVPNNPGLMMNLGMAHYMAGQPREAIRQFQAALKIEPEFLQARLLLGTAYFDAGNPAQAVESLQKVLDAQPQHPDARMMISEAFVALGRYREGVGHLEKLAQEDPRNPRLWFQLGRAYEQLSQQSFQELQQSAPESGHWMALVGDALRSQQKYPNAFYFYRQALERNPDLPGLHEALADVYQKTGHEEWARLEAAKAKEVPPLDCTKHVVACRFQEGNDRRVVELGWKQKSPEAYYYMARAYNRLAMDALARLGELPPSGELHELKAEIHFNQGRFRESVEELKRALTFSPDHPELQGRLAESLYFSRDLDAARSLLQEILRREPDAPELNFLYGRTLLEMQQVEEALLPLKKSVQAQPDLLPAHATLARAYRQLNRSEEAIPHLEKSLETDEDGSLHYQLAQAYQQVGKRGLARQMLERYREIQQTTRAEQEKLEQEIQITPP